MAARRKQQSSPLKNIVVTIVIVLIAGAFLIFKGNTPEILRQYIPPQLHSIFYPEKSSSDGAPNIGNLPATKGNSTITSFASSKTQLKKLYVAAGYFTTFYCGSTFDEDFNLDHSKSGFKFRKDETRANKVEWEHIVPAEAFGNSFAEWRDGHPNCVEKGAAYKGRKCAAKVNKQFKLMEADMYNLVPAIGEVNGDRKNYPYAMLEREEREYGACNMEIRDQKAEPPDDKYGDIARGYMYMEAAYRRGVISDKNVKLFEAWNRMDPVDKWECERARLIEKIQGNRNTIVANACQKAGL